MKKLLLILVTSVTLFSCTKNQEAIQWGGTEDIELEPNEECINLTWKQDALWLIIKNKATGEMYMREKSSFGVMEGRINIKTK